MPPDIQPQPFVDPETGDVFQQGHLCGDRPYPLSIYIKRFIWQMVGMKLFRFSPVRAFGWRRFILRRFGAKVHDTSLVYRSVEIFHPWWFEMGIWSNLGPDVVIYNLGPVKLGDHTFISQGTYLCAGSHDYTRRDMPLQRPPITIGSGVWIAAQAFIGPGVTIGNNSVIGARSVVVKDIPAGVVAAGNPARVVKMRPMNVEKADPGK